VAPPQQQKAEGARSWWERAKGAGRGDRELSFVKGLSAFTIVRSLVVG